MRKRKWIDVCDLCEPDEDGDANVAVARFKAKDGILYDVCEEHLELLKELEFWDI